MKWKLAVTICRAFHTSYRIGMAACLLFLASCVHVSDSPKNTKVDKRAAAQTRVDLGMRYLEAGERNAARRHFLSAMELDDRSVTAALGMALLHIVNKEDDHAEESFKQALSVRSDQSKSLVHFKYAQFLYARKRYNESCEHFQVVSQDLSFDQRPLAVYYTGMCAKLAGNLSAAVGSFERALGLDARLAPAALELAELRFRQRDINGARRYLQLHNSQSKQNARSLLLGIRIARIYGDRDKEASLALMLKSMYGSSPEYARYQREVEKN